PRPMLMPYFPLHVVLFPHLPLPLHIFEERYRAMAHDLVSDGSPYAGRFVVSMITDGSEVAGSRPGSGALARGQRIGTIAEVRSAEQFNDGRWVLLAAGLSRAVLGAVDDAGPTRSSRPRRCPRWPAWEPSASFRRARSRSTATSRPW